MTDAARPLVRTIPEGLAGARLDVALGQLFPDYSRARLAQWIRDGRATLDARQVRPRERVRGGERVSLDPEPERVEAAAPEAIPLTVVHEDADLLVIDKPAGLVVHPGAGNRDGTLVNALLHLDPDLAHLPRAGLVHRLDKDTSGLLVVARTLPAHHHLVEALGRRAIRRRYEAVVTGRVVAGGEVDAPVGRHRVSRTRMAVHAGGKPARTRYRVRRRFRAHSHLELDLDTGRTHQIRVHMAHLGHPLVGDPLYGARPRPPPGATPGLLGALAACRRQALHATRLGLEHPRHGTALDLFSPLPEDLRALLEALEDDLREAGPR